MPELEPNLRIFVSPTSVESESTLPAGVQIHALLTVLHKLLHVQEGLARAVPPPKTVAAAPIGRRVDG